MKFYSKEPIRDCYNKANEGPTSARWIYINKGDVERPNYRSRFVAMEINTHKRDDLIAAPTPFGSIEALIVHGCFWEQRRIGNDQRRQPGVFSMQRQPGKSMFNYRMKSD